MKIRLRSLVRIDKIMSEAKLILSYIDNVDFENEGDDIFNSVSFKNIMVSFFILLAL